MPLISLRTASALESSDCGAAVLLWERVAGPLGGWTVKPGTAHGSFCTLVVPCCGGDVRSGIKTASNPKQFRNPKNPPPFVSG